MPDVENWEKYGFPDDIMFRSPYLPWLGLIKALNERSEAVNLEPFPIPEYFSVFGGMIWEFDFEDALQITARHYVNPSKIDFSKSYVNCFWHIDDLGNAVLNGEDKVNVTSFMRPLYSVKWAIWTYNQINNLRYVATSDPKDWPDVFTYEDRCNTFNFKA